MNKKVSSQILTLTAVRQPSTRSTSRTTGRFNLAICNKESQAHSTKHLSGAPLVSALSMWFQTVPLPREAVECPIPVSAQDKFGWGFKQPGLVEGVLNHGSRSGTQ